MSNCIIAKYINTPDRSGMKVAMIQNYIEANQEIVSSYLYKKGKYTHKWHKIWVVLRNCQLSYYKDCHECRPLKVFNVKDLQTFQVIPQKNSFVVYSDDRALEFRSDNEQEFESWIIGLDRFFDGEYPVPSKVEPFIHDTKANTKEHQEFSNEYMVEWGYTKKLVKNRWQDLYLVLTNKNFYLLNNHRQLAPYKIIPNGDLVDVVELDPIGKDKFWCLLVITASEEFKIATEDEPEMVKWLSALKTISVITHRRDKLVQ